MTEMHTKLVQIRWTRANHHLPCSEGRRGKPAFSARQAHTVVAAP